MENGHLLAGNCVTNSSKARHRRPYCQRPCVDIDLKTGCNNRHVHRAVAQTSYCEEYPGKLDWIYAQCVWHSICFF